MSAVLESQVFDDDLNDLLNCFKIIDAKTVFSNPPKTSKVRKSHQEVDKSSPSLHSVASSNFIYQDWDKQQRQIDIERQRLELQKMREELRAEELVYE
ncbi:hypothetical protein ACO22_03843 [Paracoccidioides brasiliensis]|uniref:Uncharacterized protein n=1 Tax=Paracoccidioides brasiliensis TaxID=121759 RepID=A0A1D2JER0_PARBR|nr:hypothetical protein ACO22_03843 [Paracoccidioides brasiliensis]